MKKSGRQIRVLFLPAWFPRRDNPMPGLFVKFHALALAPYCRVSVFHSFPDPNHEGKPLLEEYEEKGARFHILYYPAAKSKVPLLASLVNAFRFLRYNLKYYRKLFRGPGKPDLHHVHILTRWGVLARLLQIRYGIPYVITEHWSRYLPLRNDYKGWIRKMLTRHVSRHSRLVMPVTRNLKKAMLLHKLDAPRYEVVPNVTDTTLFTPPETHSPKPKPGTRNLELRTVLHVSCFDDPPKNISGMLRAIRTLFERRQDFKLFMVGDGRDFDTLRTYAGELGLTPDPVSFEGLKEGQELVDYYQKADFLLLFSNYENMPVVINEAFACGIPVVATQVGGIPEYVSPERGILVEPGNEEALVEACSEMMDTIGDYDRQAIRRYAIEHFSYPAVGQKIKDLYTEVSGKQ